MNPVKILAASLQKTLRVKKALRKNKDMPENGGEVLMDLIYLHCISNGYLTEHFNKTIRSSKRYDLGGLSTIFSEQTWAQKDTLLAQLKTDGFCILPEKISDEKCDTIIKMASEELFLPKSYKGKVFERSLFQPPYQSARYELGAEKTLQNETFQEFLAEPFFIELATAYLGKAPILDPLELWWSAPFNLIDDEFAQNYHFDMDTFKWFKVFINFEDITVTRGPHSFIKGSHLPGTQSRKIRSKFYSRISDEDVYEHFGKDREILFTVPRGSILIEDTKGMHKGYHLSEGRRLLLSFQYSNTILTKPSKPFALPSKLHPNFKKMIEKYPEFVQKFYSTTH